MKRERERESRERERVWRERVWESERENRGERERGGNFIKEGGESVERDGGGIRWKNPEKRRERKRKEKEKKFKIII